MARYHVTSWGYEEGGYALIDLDVDAPAFATVLSTLADPWTTSSTADSV